MPDFAALASKLGLAFKKPDLLAEALTHRSYLNENRGAGKHNERLEFLGDAVLELAVTDFLFKKFPGKQEGELTSYRAALVNTQSLAEVAQGLGINDYLLLSKGEAKDTGRARQIILADTLEAIIGALYIDQGYSAAETFLATHLYPKLESVLEKRTYQDAKSRLQELVQAKGVTPTYETLDEVGPAHDKRFTVAVYMGADELARGTGQSKQEAEQAAAQAALEKLA